MGKKKAQYLLERTHVRERVEESVIMPPLFGVSARERAATGGGEGGGVVTVCERGAA